MELLPVVLLSATIGIGVGVLFGFMMSKKNRASAVDSGAAAKAASQNLAQVVAAPTVTIEDLRKLLNDRDETLQQSRDDLQKKHIQMEAANAAAENAATLRMEAEQRNAELAAQANAFSEQVRELSSKTTDYSAVVEEANRRVGAIEVQLEMEKKQSLELSEQISRLTSELTAAKASGSDGQAEFEAQLAVERKQSAELAEQIARLTSDLTGSRVAGADAVAQVEVLLEAERKHVQELTEQVGVLRVDLEQARQFGSDAETYRSTLEAELGVNRLKIMQLADQVAELNRERSQFEVKLREERQSAARGIELLTLAQSTLSALTRMQEENQAAHVEEAPAAAASPVAAKPVHAELEQSPIVEPKHEEVPVASHAEESVAVSA